jgi:hypothetical protein
MANSPEAPFDELSSFFVSLCAGRPARSIPAELVRIARRARESVGGAAAHLEDTDLAQELLTKLLERATRTGQGAAADLVALDGRALRTALFVRARQLAMATSSTSRLRRALALQVEAVLAELAERPHHALAPPASLFDGARLCRRKVREAVAWRLRESGARPPRQLTSLLAADYLPGCVVLREELELPDESADPEAALLGRRTARALAERLPATCDPKALGALLARLRGQGYQQLADESGVSLATAFARVERARSALRTLARELGASDDIVGQTLELLAS